MSRVFPTRFAPDETVPDAFHKRSHASLVIPASRRMIASKFLPMSPRWGLGMERFSFSFSMNWQK